MDLNSGSYDVAGTSSLPDLVVPHDGTTLNHPPVALRDVTAPTHLPDPVVLCDGTSLNQRTTPCAGTNLSDVTSAGDDTALDQSIEASTLSEATTNASDISSLDSRRSTFASVYEAQSSPGTSISSAGGFIPSKETGHNRDSVVEPEAVESLDPTSDTASRSSSLSPVPSVLSTPEGLGKLLTVDQRASRPSVSNGPAPYPFSSPTISSHNQASVSGPVVTSKDWQSEPSTRPQRTRKPVRRYGEDPPSASVPKSKTAQMKSTVPKKRKAVGKANNVEVDQYSQTLSHASEPEGTMPGIAEAQAESIDVASVSPSKRRKIGSTLVTLPAIEQGADASASSQSALSLALPHPTLVEQALDLEAGPEQPSAGLPGIANPSLPSAETEEAAGHQAYLLSLSTQLATRTTLEDKPPTIGLPSVWAVDRASLCETLPYYRAFKGAVYASSGLARAIMLDGNAHVRDHVGFGLKAITARAGGGMEKDGSGTMVQVKGQVDNAQSNAMTNNMNCGIPIVVIMGDKNVACPSKMPHRYCVLGWYKVTDVLHSKGQKATENIIQYRFEQLDPEAESWATPVGTDSVVGLGELGEPQEHTCQNCGVTHQQVFHRWVCLSRNCISYWKLADGTDLKVADDAPFDPRWLMKRTPWSNVLPPFPLAPDHPPSLEDFKISHPHGYDRGLLCPQCGRCISRVFFKGWVCREGEHDCDFEHLPSPTMIQTQNPFSPTMIREPYQFLRSRVRIVGQGSPISYDTAKDPIIQQHSFEYNHRINVFKFPYSVPDFSQNFIVHMIANQHVLEESHGPDDMFKEMLNQVDLGLERRALRGGGGALGRMSGFSVNHGYPYKFIAAVASRPFEGSSWVMRETRTQLNFFAGLALKEAFPNRAFNELLTFAYLEGEKLKYHDDGEYGLGPTVATFSLGAPAEMRFRMKKKYWTGVVQKRGDGTEVDEHEEENEETVEDVTDQVDSKKPKTVKKSMPYFLDEEPLVGTLNYKERKKAFDSLAGLTATEREKKCWKLPKDLTLTQKACLPLITLHLAHGDKIIMHGELIQKYFEHEVEPEKGAGIRFANTCREVLPGHLKDDEQPSYVVEPDEGNYDGRNIA